MILNGDDITDKGAIFSTTKRGKKNSVKTCRLPYSYWFDIVEAINPDEVLAEYSLSLTDKGKDKLKGINLPTSFPAVIHQENRQFETYYFSGDLPTSGRTESVPDIGTADMAEVDGALRDRMKKRHSTGRRMPR